MAINPATCITRDVIVTNQLGEGGKNRQPIIIAGNVLTKNVLPVVPNSNLLKITGNGANQSAPFIKGLVAVPIQNLNNFARSLRRFQVDRAGLGRTGIEFVALSKGNLKARVRVTATIVRLGFRDAPANLQAQQAFACLSNLSAADMSVELPPASKNNVGLEYYFAVNPEQDPGSLTITCKARDSIQIRTAQAFATPDTVIDTTTAIDASAIKGSHDPGGAGGPATSGDVKTIVLSCKAPRLWVAENVAANVTNTAPLNPDWTITPV